MSATIISASGIAYRRCGKGAGPSILLLHGIPGSRRSWQDVGGQLSGQFDVIMPDLLGFGQSHRPKELAALHAQAQAQALAAMLDELAIKRVSIAAHDFGGPVALMLSARRPALVERLALFATNAFTDTPIPFPLSLVNAPVAGKMIGRLLFSRISLRMMLKQGVGVPPVAIDCGMAIGDQGQARAIATIFAGSLTNLEELYRPVQQRLSAFKGPALVGWGDKDPFFPAAQGRRTAAALGAELRLYAGAGHFLPEERPNEIAGDLRSFFAVSAP